MFKAVSMVSAVAFLAVAACAPTPVTTDEPIRSADGSAQCRIEDWKSWEGKPRQSLPKAPEGLTFRVLCDTCAATMDYRQDRVTFSYNDATQNITRVTCG
ncbi:hemolysin [Brevundimonas sp.]|uniref:hemolysin n=2 Tax=Brevundimonas sp. TaxID=1871086 RepID=UPI002FC843AC